MAGEGEAVVPLVFTGTDGVCIDSPNPVADGPAERSLTANVSTPSLVDTATYGVTPPAAFCRSNSVGLDGRLALTSGVDAVVPYVDVGEPASPSGTLNSRCCCSWPMAGR